MSDLLTLSEEVTSTAIANSSSEQVDHLVSLAGGEDLQVNWVEVDARQVV